MVWDGPTRWLDAAGSVLQCEVPGLRCSGPSEGDRMLTVSLIGANRNAWGYLLGTVSTEHAIDRATGKADYYMAGGTPPGIWTGTGIEGLGLSKDSRPTEAQLAQLLGEGRNPTTGAQLGKVFSMPGTPQERAAARMCELGSNDERIAARMREAMLDPATHHYTQEQLTGLESRIVAEEQGLADMVLREELERKQQQSVAGFEFVFSPPKSVSSWWALGDPELKDQIRQAHHAAIQATIGKLERDIIRTRTGIDGIAQEHVAGITAALFDHWDSREGDPQLHTHMLVSNRVQGLDGRWRTIDSRWSLMPAIGTAGMVYDSALMDELSARFGIDWTTQDVLEHPERYRDWLAGHRRADTPAARHQFSIDSGTSPKSVKWQIASVPHALNREYSTRSKKLAAVKDQLIEQYVTRTGRMPTDAKIIEIRQHATLASRPAKRAQSLKALTTSWRQRAVRYVGDSFLFADRVRNQGRQRLNDLPLWTFRHDDVDDQAVLDATEQVLHALAITRSTWGRRNAETEALRAIQGWRFRSAADRELVTTRIVDTVLEQAVPLTPKNPLHTPRRFRTTDGESVFHPEARDLFTTREVWDAEERLLEAGRSQDGPVVDADLIDQLIRTPTSQDQRVLSADQVDAVTNLLSSGRIVDVLVGPAGAGKTTSLQKLREIWETQHGPGSIRGLAPSAAAAEVLAKSLGIQTENTAKWLYETSTPTTANPAEMDFDLRRGDLLIIDEASLAGTMALDQLRAQAETAGAKLLLVGDWAQLAAVDAAGAFGLLATDRDDVAELQQLHRFTETWEADASKLLRLGKTSGLTSYIDHDRIEWGLEETIITEAVDAWKRDEATHVARGDGNIESLLIAPTNDMVDRLNTIARDWRIEQGHVDASAVATIAGCDPAEGAVASPGDRIVTRQNDRRLRTDHDRWVRNGDTWHVIEITVTGDIVAATGNERVVLPRAYCTEHVQLAYATTAHRAQGRTVDTAHSIVNSSSTRETFYVAMTRGKFLNKAYVVVDEDQLLGDNAGHGMIRTWREILDRAVLNRGGDIAAHDTLHEEAERVGSVRQLAAEYQTLIADSLEREYLPLLRELGLAVDTGADSPYLGPVLANVGRLEHIGGNVPAMIRALLEAHDLGDARDVLAVLHYRLNHHIEVNHVQAQDALVARLLEPAPHVNDPDTRRALSEREHAIQLRAELLVDRAIADREPWIAELGDPLPGGEEHWRRRAVTIACYRDLYGVDSAEALGRDHPYALNRERDRLLAKDALAGNSAQAVTYMSGVEPARSTVIQPNPPTVG